jgi:ABC-type transport system involved in multi-copper enzyme maturation permease subunit
MRMVIEGIRFNLRTWPVIILLVLGWLFSMAFPVLSAAMGGLPLEADTPSTWDGTRSTQVGMHELTVNSSSAVYPLHGPVFTNQTEFSTINVPQSWSAVVNATTGPGAADATLTVIPPPSAPPMSYAMIQVVATTGKRVDSFSTLTTVAPDNATAALHFSFGLDFERSGYDGRGGDTVRVQFHVLNNGTLPDGYNITIDPLAAGWGVSAYVNGTKVPLTAREISVSGEPRRLQVTMTVRTFRLDLSPGGAARCEFRFATTVDSARANDIGISVGSRTDPAVTGSYHTVVNLSDTKKTDLTGEILYGQVMSFQVYFALLLAAVVGSRMISTDLQEKSYNLYFARPLTKRDYIAGKFGTVGAILSLVTIVPSLITYALLMLLSTISGSYAVDHLWTWGAVVGYGAVVVLTLSTLSLAFSSLTARRFYAAAAMVVIYLVTAIMSQIVMGAFSSRYGRLIGVSDNFDIVGRTAFGVTGSTDWGFPWYYSLAVLVGTWAVCTFLVWFRVERTELSE